MNERGRVLDFRPKKENGDPSPEKKEESKAVEIVRFDSPESIVLVRCVLRGGIVNLEKNEKEEGSQNIIDDLEKNGVPDPTDPFKKLFPKDGERFLQALLSHYRTVYLGARRAHQNN
ncbi:hypothetical protein HZB93_03725 [Candidatus Falkowbacteria bacterium]|nr:hypothetical protein [Candidatus Falkowbacteria bacterium]